MLIYEDPLFLEALFKHSDVIDGPVERHEPKYRDGANLLNYLLSLRTFEESEIDRCGHEVFLIHREFLMESIASYLRSVDHGRTHGWKIRLGSPTYDEARAMYQLLIYASEETQDRFLRGEPEFQQALIYAVLKDGGIYDRRGFWCELLP